MTRSLLIGACLALCSISTVLSQDKPPGARAPIDSTGLALYVQYYCGLCHVLDAAGTAGPFGPTHNGLRATAADRIRDPAYSGQATTASEYIRESIVDPTVYMAPGFGGGRYAMPSYTNLSEDELTALVTFLIEVQHVEQDSDPD